MPIWVENPPYFSISAGYTVHTLSAPYRNKPSQASLSSVWPLFSHKLSVGWSSALFHHSPTERRTKSRSGRLSNIELQTTRWISYVTRTAFWRCSRTPWHAPGRKFSSTLGGATVLINDELWNFEKCRHLLEGILFLLGAVADWTVSPSTTNIKPQPI